MTNFYLCYLEETSAAYILFVQTPNGIVLIHLKNSRSQLQNAVAVDVTVVLY